MSKTKTEFFVNFSVNIFSFYLLDTQYVAELPKVFMLSRWQLKLYQHLLITSRWNFCHNSAIELCVCMMLAKFTQMIGIWLNNFRDILFRSAVVNVSALLLLLFKIRVKMFSSLHVDTVETQRYAFLLFSVIMTVTTGVFLPSLWAVCGTQRFSGIGIYFV